VDVLRRLTYREMHRGFATIVITNTLIQPMILSISQL
jgi:hypothetical protein